MFIVNPNTYIPKAATKNETGIPKAVIKATLEFKNKYNYLFYNACHYFSPGKLMYLENELRQTPPF